MQYFDFKFYRLCIQCFTTKHNDILKKEPKYDIQMYIFPLSLYRKRENATNLISTITTASLL